jgi:hypothetical protein
VYNPPPTFAVFDENVVDVMVIGVPEVAKTPPPFVSAVLDDTTLDFMTSSALPPT